VHPARASASRISAPCIDGLGPCGVGSASTALATVAGGSHWWFSYPGHLQHPHGRNALPIDVHDVAPSLPDGSALQ
jgi:hypothetical protein